MPNFDLGKRWEKVPDTFYIIHLQSLDKNQLCETMKTFIINLSFVF